MSLRLPSLRLPSSRELSDDERVRAFCVLLVPSMIAHAIQLLGEDTPWAPHAWSRYWLEPGSHLYLPPIVPALLALALAGAVLGLALRRTRPWVLAVVALYAAHYLTYPYRIRNHMTHMLFGLLMLGGLWLIARKSPHPRRDAHVPTGLAVVLCVTYFFAGFHKINEDFLSLGVLSSGGYSSGVEGIRQFWIYGDLGSEPPRWVKALATWGTVAIECCVPVLTWRVRRLRVAGVLTLFAFHFPMVSVMNVSDYPMIASAFYPALFSRAHFRLVLRYAGRASAWNVGGAVLGVAGQLWFMPWWGALTVFGLFVMALWGWAAGSMVEMSVSGRRRRGSRRPTARASASRESPAAPSSG